MDILLLTLRLLLAILLYAFLAAVMVVVWRDLRQATTSREINRRKGELVVLQTSDEALEIGTAFPLQTVTSIGRAPSNTIIISDTYASSQHALLTWREGQWWLEDQDSRNGTLLNETRIAAPTVVSAGDVVGIGRTQLKLELD
jgi:pSer/pThr/pTyr-binding forkhead associated (FHA) protein